MRGNQSVWRSVATITAAVAGMLVMATVPVAQAADEGPGKPPKVLSLDSSPYGNTYGEWSARWWQWLLAIPAATNPALDTTGENCAVGQVGPVWFLAGTFGGDPVTRYCTVPEGKALLVTVLNAAYGAGTYDCDPSVPGTLCDLNALRSSVAKFVDTATRLELTVDGGAVRNVADYRVQSPAFELTLPEDNFWTVFGLDLDPGKYSPHVSEGYWLLLEPLPAGEHTIHFEAEGVRDNGSPFLVDVTYHLTIAP